MIATMNEMTLDVFQETEIEAAIGDVFQNLIARLSSENTMADNQPMPMVLEPWPGGRWFRDLGNGQGHWWGLMQVIKPPNLLEIHGPLFMSYAVTGHVQFRVTPVPGGARLSIRHQAVGMIAEDHRQGLTRGWQSMLESVKTRCESA